MAAALGAVASAGLPPWGAVPLLIPAFTGLVWLIDGSRQARAPLAAAALAGWWFGVGHFASGLYWVAEALLVDADSHAWLIPFAVGGLAAGLGLFPALAAALTRMVVGAGWAVGAGRVLAFAGLWTLVEWVRGWIFTGFPWHLVGTAWSGVDAMLQPAALFGIWGLSLLTVAAAAAPACLADGRRGHAVLAGSALALALAWTGGLVRLAAAPDADTVPGVRLRLVQASIPQRLKWLPELRAQHLATHVTLSLRPPVPGAPAPTHVIWPETAVPFLLLEDEAARAAAARAVPSGGLLITGTVRADGRGQAWNSLVAIDRTAAVVATYDKAHLVPFGEYAPLRGILPLGKLIPGDFVAGPGRVTLRLPGLPPASPLICYEAIFPSRVLAASDRPAWLLNVTNDAWFGAGAGPRQHLATARMRAVEEGVPLVRAANTGISAVVDPYGRVVARLGLGVAGVLDADLPRALGAVTPYGRLGDWWLAILGAGLVPLVRLAAQRGGSHLTASGKPATTRRSRRAAVSGRNKRPPA